VLLSLGAAGCGTGVKSSDSTSSSSTAGIEAGSVTTRIIPPGQRLRGDGDADNPSDIDGNGDIDARKDSDNDFPVPASYKFPDGDDKIVFAYGHPPSGTDRLAISSIVRHYYAAASAGDGAAACSLLSSSIAGSVAEDYGQAPGPSYLQGGKTCKAVMSMLFRHFHEQLAEAITVVEVRVKRNDAQVVFGSRAMPASSIFLIRRGGSWKVQALLGQPLP
jgi:hypothetical protein